MNSELAVFSLKLANTQLDGLIECFCSPQVVKVSFLIKEMQDVYFLSL